MSSETTKMSAPRALHCYAAAGELFGHLREALGFGELVMFTRTWGDSAPPRVMAYQWTFKAKGERYCIEHSVPLVELEHMRSVEAFASHLSDQWKHQQSQNAEAD
jgi:hypothetical protein